MFDLYSPCRLDDVQSIEASIIKFTHHRQSRSLKSRRHYPASLKSRFRNIIHATIRGKSNTRFTDPESVDRHHHRDKSRRTSISKSPVKRSEITRRPVSTSTSGAFWNTIGVTYAGNGSQGSALNQLSSPTGIFIDSSDILYINDGGNYRSLKYLSGATSGILIAGTGTSGSASNQLGGSTRFNYVDSNQNIYISDGSNNRVMRWANGASMGVIVAGDGTSGTSLNQTRTPYGVWVDSSSNIFVAEFTNHRVTRWSSGAKVGVVVAGGNLQGTTPDKLSAPSGIFFDETNQDLYIVNGIANTVVKWRVGASNGTVLAGVPGSSGASSTYLSFPVDLTLDRWNNIYVADRTNVRIQLFCNGSSTGITIAGSGSSLILPYSVALDSQLNLYVSDNGAARIIKFSKL
ncbi:unnamed protein product [Rotaria sordida]|uniref:Uncharacterized protein n=1 Tax=Rotaria sordida TaxID=392033 RepID=A0A814Q7S8_9BILA|nr:unnamed protein product [Rotaria sordida]